MHNKKLKQLMDQLYNTISEHPNVNHFEKIEVDKRILSDNTFTVSFKFEFIEPGFDATKESWNEYGNKPIKLNDPNNGVINLNVD